MTALSFTPDGVLFDCDSTLSTIEGIDELAEITDCQEEIVTLTNQAMNGEVLLEDVYAKRLAIIRPHRFDIEHVANMYCETMTTGAKAVIAALKAAGIRVGIVSGGLREAILPLAEELSIAPEDVFAVDIAFNDSGYYENLIPSPLATAKGKYEVVAAWKKHHQLERVVLIGDGASDVAALGAADAVIGYGGVVARENVRHDASLFYTERDLLGLLALLGVQG
ncbi:HAD-IB family phosphatase [Suttonella sp. R2A3]|uniref:HAD-IB family phosphatase n=1 Tax=Suttonella sp. R2A3 TaxID=2908648 RepID=UPI001F46BDE0|nr:HAD-IB family phosphatase [Suttonella sp. R2A3]UJF25186.1 HAD-IB family phosphatase [Suttonella sp. R2A3]